jgi:ADP-heptose:LPS heptosyltransferase
MVGKPVDVDVALHKGELDFEVLAALAHRASLCFASPGFLIPLAQATGCPSICVFGGYENGQSFSLGARLTRHLAIEPVNPCQCFRHNHDCNKNIDLASAARKIEKFINGQDAVADRQAIAVQSSTDRMVVAWPTLHESR